MLCVLNKFINLVYSKSFMIAQWENEGISLSVLPVARVQFPAMAEYFKGFFLG